MPRGYSTNRLRRVKPSKLDKKKRVQHPIQIYNDLWPILVEAARAAILNRTAFVNRAVAHYMGVPLARRKGRNNPITPRTIRHKYVREQKAVLELLHPKTEPYDPKKELGLL